MPGMGFSNEEMAARVQQQTLAMQQVSGATQIYCLPRLHTLFLLAAGLMPAPAAHAFCRGLLAFTMPIALIQGSLR